MPTAQRLRWGLLGCARISRRGWIPGIQGSPQSELVAIASRDLAKAQSWAAEFGVPRAYGSYEEELADPNIDAICIPLPNELHEPWVLAAADAGKHVLCDKPLALDADRAEKMVAHCKARGVLLMEGFMWRHQPRTAALRKLVAEGAIGTLRLVRSTFSFPIEPGDWRLDPARGGGALWDIGCYGVSTARLFAAAEPREVCGFARIGASEVDMSLTAGLGFPGGVLGQIDCSFEQPFRCSYELVGTTGSIDVPDAYLPPERPIAILRAGADTRELSFEARNQYAATIDAFTASAAAGRLLDPGEDGLAQMRALCAIRGALRHLL